MKISRVVNIKEVWWGIKLISSHQVRNYRILIETKRTTFWSDKIETLQQEPRQMWRVIDDLSEESATLPVARL